MTERPQIILTVPCNIVNVNSNIFNHDGFINPNSDALNQSYMFVEELAMPRPISVDVIIRPFVRPNMF